MDEVTIIAGDPIHDLINLRRKVSAMASDGQDMIRDHADLCSRLSAAPTPFEWSAEELASATPTLSDDAKTLLRVCVERLPSKARLAVEAAPEAAAEVRAVLSHPKALVAPVWTELFVATPPRNTVARIAGLFRAPLHKRCRGHGWKTKAELREEVKRIRAWYKPGRKKARVRKITRDIDRTQELKGLRTAWNKKVAKHFKQFTSRVRLDGLWAWRQLSHIYREAGIPLQTGTVSVERTWSSLLAMAPDPTRTMGIKWWNLLSSVCFIRHNLRHFAAAGQLPTWAESDFLLAARVDALASLTRRVLAGEPLDMFASEFPI